MARYGGQETLPKPKVENGVGVHGETGVVRGR